MRFDASVVDAVRASGLKAPRATVYADAINMRTRLAAMDAFSGLPAYIMRFPGKHLSLKVVPVDFSTTRRQIGIITVKEPHAEPRWRAVHRPRPRISQNRRRRIKQLSTRRNKRRVLALGKRISRRYEMGQNRKYSYRADVVRFTP